VKGLIIPVLLYTLTMTATPGPNNILLTASGARFGFRKTLPFIGGIVLGIMSQLLLSAIGLGVLFTHFPVIQKVMKIAGCIYIFYLAVKIILSESKRKNTDMDENPVSLVQGALFQYLNPKAYVMTITAMSVYPMQGDGRLASILLVFGCFLIVMPLSISLWAGFGSLINNFISHKGVERKLNFVLGGLTAASAVFILL